MLADHRRQFETVELRHVDVDQDHREFVLEQKLQRFLRGRRLEQSLVEVAQDDLVAQQLRRLIVDQQQIDFGVVGHGHVQRCSHMRNDDSNCSVLTGFAR